MSVPDLSALSPPAGARVRAVHDEFHGDLLEVSMGPHHPSTHGVFRMIATLDGETVVKLKPVFGYLHRNHEKIGETTTYLGSMPYTDRLDYFCSMTNNWAYAIAVERLAGQAVPERAEYLRIILAELTRLLNHTCLAGFLLQDGGASGTPLMYAFREREKILDLFESLSGSRMMCNFQRFGGCRTDASPAWLAAARGLVDGYGRFLDEFEALLTGNEILMARTQGIGVLPAKLAVSAGVTGPMLRASGCRLRHPQGRRLRPLSPLRLPRAARATHGDIYDRYMVRVLEMRESIDDAPAGPARHPGRPGHGSQGQAARLPREARGGLRPDRGPEGRDRVLPCERGRAQPLPVPGAPALLRQPDDARGPVPGPLVADTVVILGSVDIVLGEVDR